MYSTVKSCVKNGNLLSDFFDYTIGLRQGETISPILVSLFLEDLELFLLENPNSGININELSIIILLFADDMVIFAKNPSELQSNIDKLSEYCDKWGLEVNVDKTKTMVFRKRGPLKLDELWTYKGKSVDNFSYLGTLFHYTGSFAQNREYLSSKALKALNVLLVNCSKFRLSAKILCQLFDAFVGSILGYSCETWGKSKSKDIERIHLKFCKRILCVNNRSCNMAVYGELGRYPLYITRYIRIVKYWFKIMNSNNIIIQDVYNDAYGDYLKGKKNWVSDVKSIFDDFGFSEVFINPTFDLKEFVPLLKERMIDCFKQEWFAKISNSTMLTLYKHVKSNFKSEEYLDKLPLLSRSYICKLRISAHSLQIQTGRFSRNNIPRNERLCQVCQNGEIEDEFHFSLVCPKYEHLRRKYLDKYFYIRPSMFKFIALLSSNELNVLSMFGNYLTAAFSLRFNTLYS